MGHERATESDELGPRADGRTFTQMLIVGVLASALGIAVGIGIDWFPEQASTQAEKIDLLWDVLLVASVVIFAIVATIVGFSVKQFRMRPGQEHLDGPPLHGSTRLEVVWTLIPAVILTALCAYSYIVLVDIEEAPAGKERNVVATGEQFTWTFEYREGGKAFKTAQLYVPQGESVKFLVRSRDVLHSFWVPAWRMKIDAVPGLTTNYRVTPTKPGTYPIVCAELCGLGHAFMRQTAHVLPKAKFDAWVQTQIARTGGAAPAPVKAGGGKPPAGGGAAIDAKALFLEGNAAGATACGACHTLADAAATQQIGPDLDASLAGKDADYIRKSIVDPAAGLAEGFGNIMPANYGDVLSPEELDALVKYLSEVTSK